VDVYPKLESGVTYLVLESESYELGLVLFEGESKGSSPLKANGAAAVFDVAEMGSRDAEKFGELSEALAVGLPDSRQGATESERTAEEVFEEGCTV
jgi:hypothetical protein